MLVHRMVKKVKDSKVLAKVGMKDAGYIVARIGKYEIIEGSGPDGGWWFASAPGDKKKFKTEKKAREHAQLSSDSKMKDSRGYKVTDQIIKGFMIYKTGTNFFTAKNENGEQYEGTMEEIKKRIDDYWVKRDEDVMKQKVRDKNGSQKMRGFYKGFNLIEYENQLIAATPSERTVATVTGTTESDLYTLKKKIDELNFAGDSKTKDTYTKNRKARNMHFRIKGDKLPVGLKKKVKDASTLSSIQEQIKEAKKDLAVAEGKNNEKEIRDMKDILNNLTRAYNSLLNKDFDSKTKDKIFYPEAIIKVRGQKKKVSKPVVAESQEEAKEKLKAFIVQVDSTAEILEMTCDSKIKVKDSIKSRFNFKKVRDFDDNNVFTMQDPKTKMYKVWNNKQLVGIYSSESEADNVADYQRRLNSKKTKDAEKDIKVGTSAIYGATMKRVKVVAINEKGMSGKAYNVTVQFPDGTTKKTNVGNLYTVDTKEVGTNDAMSKEEAIKAFKELEDKRDKAKKAGNQSEAARLDKEIDALFNREAGFKDGVFTSEGVPLNIAYKYGRWDAESGKSKEEHPFKIGSPQHNEWLKGYEFEKRFKSKDSEIRDVIELKKSDAPDDQFDAEQLAMGIEVEKEHTDNPEIAKAIAKAHLSEIKDYYTRLAKMESEAKTTDKTVKDGGPGSGIKGHTTAEEETQSRPAAGKRDKGFIQNKEHAKMYINAVGKNAKRILGAGFQPSDNGFILHEKGSFGDKKTKLIISKLGQSGFKRIDFNQIESPDGTRNTLVFKNPNGDKMEVISYYGEKSYQNAHSISYIPKFLKEAKAKVESEAKTTDKKVKDADYYCPKCNALMNTKVEAMAAEAKGTKDEKRIIAKWEAKGGKQYINLYDDGTYHSNNGGGNTGKTGNEAIQYMENNTVRYFKMDYPSVKRVI